MDFIESVKVSEHSKVVIHYENGWYTARHFKNGCSHGLECRESRDRKVIDEFINKLKELLNE